MNIKRYYGENVRDDTNLEFLTKIVKGAARALAQLNEYGIVHLNVIAESFAYTKIPEYENEIENCKLTGLDKAVKLPKTLTKPATMGDVEKQCSICFEANSNYFLFQLSCKHFVHVNCIKRWMDENPVCPTCKKAIDKKVSNILYYSELVLNLPKIA
uniref:RING-type domain-containing protein n=1 Tax=Meloidogyne hapla TaxID=6305 RepID=A0A1I8BP03_MELHA